MNNFQELKDKITQSKNIIIFSHVNPDGDTLGSNLALSLMIEKYFNKKADSVFVGKNSKIYTYLPSYEKLIGLENVDENKIYDLAISVDVAAKDRMLSAVNVYDKAKFRVNIDHHKTNIGFGNLNIIDENAACVGSILYKIFINWGFEIPLEVARCLYTSLMTDTGCFKYDNTTPDTFILAAKLVELGVSPVQEYRACYESKPQSLIQFQAHVISNTQFYENGKIAITKITKNDINKFNASDDYSEGIVEELRKIKTVEISALLKESSDDCTKISLRSKNKDLTPIVSYFGGGGHAFAAGCTIKKPIVIATEKLIEKIKSEL